MSNKIRICITGLGRAGQIHLNTIASSPAFRLKYLVDPNSVTVDNLSLRFGGKALNSFEKALEDDELDAVVISSPTDYHFDYIKKALQAGKHVFCEKPLSNSLEELKDCYDLAATMQLALYVGFQRRCDKSFMAIKGKLPELGDHRLVKASSRDNPKPSLEYLKTSQKIFHDMLIHDFDMLLFLFGAQVPNTIYATGFAHDRGIGAIPDYDTVLVTITYTDGLICSIDSSRTAPYGYDQRIEVFGENGMVCAENESINSLEYYETGGIKRDPFKHSFPERYAEAYTAELEQFAEGINEGKLINVTKSECVLGHLMADAALESATSGKVVDFKTRFGDKLVDIL